jgi:two-component system, sensor histidine kinase and response regulator
MKKEIKNKSLLKPEVLLNLLEDLEKEKRKLEKSEEKLRIVTENVMDAIFTKDVNRKYTFVNSPAAKMIGFPVEKIIGKTPEELFSKEDAQKIRKIDNINFKGKKVEQIEKITVDKQEHFLRTSQNSLRDANKKIIGIVGVVRDVTEEKKAEIALKKSEKRFQDIVMSSVDWIWEVDKNGKYVFVAGDVEKILGYSSKEIIGKTPFDFMVPSEAKRVSVIFKEIVKNKKSIVDLENWNLTKDGKKILLLTNGIAILDKEGNLLGYRGVDKDITKKKKAEKELEKLASVVKHTKELVNLSNAKGEMIFINHAGSEMLGIEPRDVKKHSIMEVIPKHLQSLVKKELLPALMAGKVWEGNLQYKNIKTNKITDVHAITFSIKDMKTGKIKCFANVSRDITERKKFEQELKESKEKAEKYLDLAGNLIVALNSKGEIVMLNKKGYKILGHKEGTLLGKNWFDCCLPKGIVKDVKEVFSKLMEGKGKFVEDYENSIVTKKGEERLISWHNTLLNGVPGKIKGILSSGEDITEIRKLNGELEQKVEERTKKLKQSYKKLQELDKMKSKFLTISSHELKTPLTPTKIQVQMFLEGEFGELTPDQKKSFEIISRNMDRLDHLIGDILEISRVEAEGFKLKLSEIDVGNSIKEVFKSMKDVANKKKIKLSYKVYPLPQILADEKRIVEVLENLVNNSLKFMEKGSVSIEAKKQKDNILVKVKDTGIGISKEHREKIFEAFFQIEPMYTRKYGGTGLGLNICSGIVKQHGGKIWVESELGKGSTFYFTLPLKQGKVLTKKIVKPVVEKQIIPKKIIKKEIPRGRPSKGDSGEPRYFLKKNVNFKVKQKVIKGKKFNKIK